MFMGGGFCESPLMSLSTVTINGEKFYFDFIEIKGYPIVKIDDLNFAFETLNKITFTNLQKYRWNNYRFLL